MCWPDADPYWDLYYSARKAFLKDIFLYSGYHATREDSQHGIKIRFSPMRGGDSSLVILNSYFTDEEANPPVLVFTEDEALDRYVESHAAVKAMRENMQKIRDMIFEDRVLLRIKYGDF